MKKTKSKREDISGLFIPGGIFIGMGFGFIFNELVPGLFIGMGVGFILMAITKLLKK